MLIYTRVHSHTVLSLYMPSHWRQGEASLEKKFKLFVQISAGEGDLSLQSVFAGIEGMSLSADW